MKIREKLVFFSFSGLKAVEQEISGSWNRFTEFSLIFHQIFHSLINLEKIQMKLKGEIRLKEDR